MLTFWRRQRKRRFASGIAGTSAMGMAQRVFSRAMACAATSFSAVQRYATLCKQRSKSLRSLGAPPPWARDLKAPVRMNAVRLSLETPWIRSKPPA